MSEVNASNVRDFPMVVVQLPMFNEKEVCGNVIDAVLARVASISVSDSDSGRLHVRRDARARRR